jgi:threonine/homoserine/homoserine lactone efflux protein
MELLEFGVQVIAISASGALAPGPLFFTNMLYGARHGAKAGLRVAYGHTVVELPLIVLLAAGLLTSAAAAHYAGTIGLVGGVGILGFAALQIANVVRKKNNLATPAITRNSNKSPFIAGIALTALNPFFLLWWFTVGLKLVADSVTFGFAAGIVVLFAFHIWMDYAWLVCTAYLASKGGSVLKSKYYSLLMVGVAVVLAYYGLTFVLQASQ